MTMTRENRFERLKKRVCHEVVENLDFTDEILEEAVFSKIDDLLINLPERKTLSFPEVVLLRNEIFNSLRRLDVIQSFLEDDTITEIMVNGKDNIFIERDGRLIKTGKSFESTEKLEDVVQQIVAGCNRTVNEASPIVDARLPSGERVNIVLAPVALNGPIVTIRRFPKNPITLDKLEKIGSVSKEASTFLKRLVFAKYNIFISGGTGSGKTTFLNALSQYIPSEERIITIEDSAELQLLNAENLVRLESRNRNTEDCVPITIRDLIKTALRMRPERIIVGECRGAEALDMLQAMNTGHDGSLSTGHGNSPKDMISRLETMVLMGSEIPIPAIRGQIAGGIDIFVHLSRMRDKSRKVVEISEVDGIEDGMVILNTVFAWNGTKLSKVGTLHNIAKFERTYDSEELERIKNEL